MLSRVLRSLLVAVAFCVTGGPAARPQTNALPPVSTAGEKIHIRAIGPIAITVDDMDRAYAVLRQNRVEHASSGPQRLPDWNKNAGGIKAFYFKDPDEHPVEILQFPEGKGDPKWHQPSDRLFLGIDHTAIVVSDTDASLRFSRDLPGLPIAGT